MHFYLHERQKLCKDRQAVVTALPLSGEGASQPRARLGIENFGSPASFQESNVAVIFSFDKRATRSLATVDLQ